MYGVVLPAGGVGSRMGSNQPKQFLEIQGRPIYRHALDVFINHPMIDEIVFVCAEEWVEYFEEEFLELPVLVVRGGRERWNSVYNGLRALSSDIQGVLVHDVARPFLSSTILDECLQSLQSKKAFIVAKQAVDTIKVEAEGLVSQTLNRDHIWLAQTPQGAPLKLLLNLFAEISNEGLTPTDESSILEHFKHPVSIIKGSHWNDKITTPEDLQRFRAWMKELP